MGSRLVLSILALAVLTVPAVTAHTSYTTTDGDRIIVGSRNEPIYLFQPTGLDLIIRDGDGNPISNAHNYLQATLIAPDGSELSRPLAARHGTPGTYNFDQGFMYTMEGAYQLRLTGTYKADGPDVTGVEIFVGSAPTTVDPPIYFPHTEFPDPAAMAAQIQALEARIATLENSIRPVSNQSPGLGPLALLGALGLLAVARRRLG